jgi:hypothetical protein
LDLTFFGLTSDLVPQTRVNLFSQIHEIVFHGQGGYDYETIYNMPIWLRKFTFETIKKWFEEQNTQDEDNMDRSIQNMKQAQSSKTAPQFAQNAYKTKVSPKK